MSEVWFDAYARLRWERDRVFGRDRGWGRKTLFPEARAEIAWFARLVVADPIVAA